MSDMPPDNWIPEEPPWLQAAFDAPTWNEVAIDEPMPFEEASTPALIQESRFEPAMPDGDFSIPAEIYGDEPLFDLDDLSDEPTISSTGVKTRQLSDFELEFIGQVAQNQLHWEGGVIAVQPTLSQDGMTAGYEVDYFDLYRDPMTSDLSGKVLPLAFFDNESDARAFRQDLRLDAAEQGLGDYDFLQMVEAQALENTGKDQWYPMTEGDWSLYNQLAVPARSSDIPDDFMDDPAHFSQLLREAFEIGQVPELEEAPSGMLDAFKAIGLEGVDFDPVHDPPPLFDEVTETAYWIGVYQPDPEDNSHAVTNILSLGRDEDGEWQAMLAPCAEGEWDHAYRGAEHLLKIAAETQDVERVFESAEAMAVATQHRDLWDTPQGIELEPEMAQAMSNLHPALEM